MSTRNSKAGRFIGVLLLFVAVTGINGCDGVSIVIDRPQECFMEDIVETTCFPQETLVIVCEEIFPGFEECFEEWLIEEVCEEVVIDSFLICN